MQFQSKGAGKGLLVLVCIAALAHGKALANSPISMQSMDLISTPSSTEIFLHSGRIIPYRVVLASDNKVVIDIDEVNPNETINTNFKGADNVTHVIFQPLSGNQLRLILRGRHLAAPSIGFKEKDLYAPASSTPVEKPITLESSTADMAPIPTSSTTSDVLPKEKTPIVASTEEEPFPSTQSTAITDTPSAAPTQPAPEALNLSALASEQNVSAEKKIIIPNKPSGLFALLNELDLGLTLQFSVLGLLLLGLGVFIRHKLQSIQALSQDNWASPTDRKEKRRMSTGPKQTRANPVGKNIRKKADSADLPIGLGALKGSAQPALQRDTLESRAQRPLQNNPSKQQAVNQYKKQSKAPLDSTPRRQTSSESLRREIQRSTEIKRRTFENPSAPARKSNIPNYPARKPNQNTEPLAGNPEVLNFLRSVADMMDKDGKPNIARNIHERVIKPSLY